MNSLQIRHAVASMSKTQRDYLRTALVKRQILADIFGCGYNKKMCQFIKDELDGLHPKLLERRKRARNKNGKVYYVTAEQIEKEEIKSDG